MSRISAWRVHARARRVPLRAPARKCRGRRGRQLRNSVYGFHKGEVCAGTVSLLSPPATPTRPDKGVVRPGTPRRRRHRRRLCFLLGSCGRHSLSPHLTSQRPLSSHALASSLPRLPHSPLAHCLHPALFPVFCRSLLLPDYFLTLTAAGLFSDASRYVAVFSLLLAVRCRNGTILHCVNRWTLSKGRLTGRYTFKNCLWKLKWGHVPPSVSAFCIGGLAGVRISLVSDTERQGLWRSFV